MKKAFTLIEVIFVIIILGALAAVAIPKLNATRDDAEVVKANQNIALLVGDVAGYYTAHSGLSNDFSKMTNVALENGVYKVKGKPCLKFSVNGYFLVVEKTSGQDKVCDIVLNDSKTIANLTGKTSPTNSNTTDITKGTVYIQVGGSNINY